MTSSTTVAAVIADILVRLSEDPELRAMAELNDAEHFEVGCSSPAFARKVARAALAVRDEGVSPRVVRAAVEAAEVSS
jgi:hypothetical protein